MRATDLKIFDCALVQSGLALQCGVGNVRGPSHIMLTGSERRQPVMEAPVGQRQPTDDKPACILHSARVVRAVRDAPHRHVRRHRPGRHPRHQARRKNSDRSGRGPGLDARAAFGWTGAPAGLTVQPAQGFAPGVRHEYLADGRMGEGACAVRWWLEKLPDLAAPWLTLRCSTPGAEWAWSGELPGASPATIRLKVEALQVEEAAKVARKPAQRIKAGG